MRKLLIPLLVLISSFIFISKPKAVEVTKYWFEAGLRPGGVNTTVDVGQTVTLYEIDNSPIFLGFNFKSSGLGNFVLKTSICVRTGNTFTISSWPNSTISQPTELINTKEICYVGGSTTKGYLYYIYSHLVFSDLEEYSNDLIRIYRDFPDRYSSLTLTLVDFKLMTQSEYDIITEQEKTNEKLDGINNSITDETPPNTSEFGNVAGWLPAGPVDSIITLPLNALNSISNALNGNCSTINLPLPFIDSTLPLTCGTEFYSQVSGLSLFLNTLFTVLGGITLYKYFVYLYNWVDRIVSLKEKDEKWGAV